MATKIIIEKETNKRKRLLWKFWWDKIYPFLIKTCPEFTKKCWDRIDRYYQWREFKGPEIFEESVITIRASSQEIEPESLSSYIENFSAGNPPTAHEILNHIEYEAKNNRPTRFKVNVPVLDEWEDGSVLAAGLMINLMKEKDEIDPEKILIGPEHFRELEILDSQSYIMIRGLHIDVLYLRGPVETIVDIEGCCINQIIVEHPVSEFGKPNNPIEPISLHIRDSWIGNISLGSKTINNFRVMDSWVLSIDCPPPEAENPFTGSVEFYKNVKLPISKKSRVFRNYGTQQYRNLRAHFEKLQNSPMAGLMRAKELGSERLETEWGLTRFFSWIYSVVSDYGRKPLRAFFLGLGLLAINVVILTYTNGIEVNSKSPFTKPWDTSLSKFNKATNITIQSAMNPFRVHVARSALGFKTQWAQNQTFILVFLADGAFIFCGLAIRKRLKVK